MSRRLLSSSTNTISSIGFSGAGFLGCYHVGVAASLHKHGLIPNPSDDDSSDMNKMPLLTGVSAGSMIASATLAGVNPEPDGMEVVLTAARRTRELQNKKQLINLDVLTPGFSLIDQVESPFRKALVKALGGYCETDTSGNTIIHDIDPELFARRFPNGSLRIGLTDRRGLWPPPLPFNSSRLLESYRYVDTFRNLEDVVACCMLSSYIPGATSTLPSSFLRGVMSSDTSDGNTTISTCTTYRAGLRLKEIAKRGMVKHGITGLPVIEDDDKTEDNKEVEDDTNEEAYYWDGGIADVFPTIDKDTVIVSPVNGLFEHPAICPRMPSDRDDSRGDATKQSTTILQQYLIPYLPDTFKHCPKSQLGINEENFKALLVMAFSSEDEEYISRFREGYDDATRFLNERGLIQVLI